MEPVDLHLEQSSAVKQFWAAPDEALFPQTVLAAVTNLSEAYFERARWEGDGPKYFKLGRLVRYKKKDVLAWIEKRPAVSSTTEAAEKFGPQFGSPRDPAKNRSNPAPNFRQRPRPRSRAEPAPAANLRRMSGPREGAP
jgi:predicted DNA-binding transcriptional regulator AlpA